MAVVTIRRALISVSDKSGLVDFARALQQSGVELISTGGTRKTLVEAGLAVRDISEVTEFPEMLDGRVKTLHPRVHGGILALRDNPEHVQTIAKHGIQPIDLVVCNLYPFEATVAKAGATDEEIIENIDIGGPSMVRSAAKNFHHVAIVTDSSQYDSILSEIKAHGGVTLELRRKLAAAAFARTAAYDAAISAYFTPPTSVQALPARMSLGFQLRMPLRYGENPHQPAAFYVEGNSRGANVATAEILHGKELSYNNLLDLDSALNLVREFSEPAAVVIKHNNPCGAAASDTLEEAFRKAYEGDPLSAFGGILSFNRELDEATAMQITEPNRFIECIIAPNYGPKAFEILTTRPSWKKNVRVLRTGPLTKTGTALDFRRVDGGLLVQARDTGIDEFGQLKVATTRTPSEQERADLLFAWLVCKHVKSNAIVLAKNRQVLGVGAGQMSRVDSVQIAVKKAGDRGRGSVLASDAFFPFRDNVDAAAAAGVTAIVQPGGSMRDQDSIDACNQHGLTMVFTGYRHFRH